MKSGYSYLDDVDAGTVGCSASDADADQVALILGDRYAPGCDSHPAAPQSDRERERERKKTCCVMRTDH